MAKQRSRSLGVELGPRQEQRQTNRLVLTPQMRESLQLLQMPAAELYQFIQDRAIENPAIDLEGVTEARDVAQDDAEVAEDQPFAGSYDEDDYYVNGVGSWASSGEFDKFARAAAPMDYRDDLLRQVGCTDVDKTEALLCRVLIESLDERGFLPEEPLPPRLRKRVPPELLSRSVALLQSLEPAGVGATNLEQCLILQLDRMGSAPQACYEIVRKHLDLLAANRMVKLARELGVTRGVAQHCASIVRSLSPAPLNGTVRDSPVYIRPEAKVVATDTGELVVVPINRWSELLSIDDAFRLLGSNEGSSTADYISRCLADARRLLQEVTLRDTVLLGVIRVVANRQAEAMFDGLDSLVPLSMREVAQTLGVSESTVSRAVQDKWVLTPCGMVALRSFFSSVNYGGDEAGGVSARSVKALIRELVESEDSSRPLSDQKISEEIVSRGINISRRTVAKYRTEMGIAPRSGRILR